MSPTLQFVPVRTPEQLATVAELAHEIWYEFYVPLIGRAQVDYMVDRFQNAAAMQAQIDQGYEYFLVKQADTDGKAREIGYCALQEQADGALFLSKFYLLKSTRGSGTGRKCMEFIEELARRRGLADRQQRQSVRTGLSAAGFPDCRRAGDGYRRRLRDGRLPNGKTPCRRSRQVKASGDGRGDRCRSAESRAGIIRLS
jgi:GNAT superfamily N-acetyltransferase